MDAKKNVAKTKKWHGGETCLLEPEDFPDDDKDDFWGSEIFRAGDDIGYLAEKIRKGYVPIKGRKL